MLKIKSPIEIKCGRPIASSHEAFGQRIMGNYQMITARLEREDLLHVIASPPEIYIGDSGLTSIVEDTRIQNIRETKLTVVNNLLNRIALTEDVDLTYQDRVYITDALHRLGVTNVSEFMNQVRALKQETQNIEELTSLYWNHMDELNSTVKAYEIHADLSRSTKEAYAEETRIHLHEDILNRLKTGAVYQILNNFYSSNEAANTYISGQELSFAEQQRTASRILLNRLQTEALGDRIPLTYYHENYYEENNSEISYATEEAANSRITSAVLLNLIDDLYMNMSVKNVRGGDVWPDMSSALYQASENTLRRLYYVMGGQSLRTQTQRETSTAEIRLKRRETELIREILSAHGQEEIPETGILTAPTNVEFSPYGEAQAVDMIYADGVAAKETDVADTQTAAGQKERATSPVAERMTERELTRVEEIRDTVSEIVREREISAEAIRNEAEREAPAQRSRKRRRNSDNLLQEQMEAPEAPELIYRDEISRAADASEAAIQERQRTEETAPQQQSYLERTLERYITLVRTGAEERQEAAFAELSYLSADKETIKESAEKAEEVSGVLDKRRGGSTAGEAVQDAVPEQIKIFLENALPPDGEARLLEAAGRETIRESRRETDILRERLTEAPRVGDTVDNRSYAENVDIYYGAQKDEETENPEVSKTERIQRELQEFNRRNIENYEKYQQFLKTRAEAEAQKKRPERPPLERMRQESLTALERPEQIMEEHSRRAQEADRAEAEAQKSYMELLPQDMRILYERLEEAAAERRMLGQAGDAEQNANINRLIYDVRETERAVQNETSEQKETRREIEETSRTVLERRREYAEQPVHTDRRTTSDRSDVSLVHKSTENYMDEETLQEILARERLINRRTETVSRVEENRKAENSRVVNSTEQTLVTEQRDLEELIERGMRRQMSTLSDQVYAKLERRLENEKKRRGY